MLPPPLYTRVHLINPYVVYTLTSLFRDAWRRRRNHTGDIPGYLHGKSDLCMPDFERRYAHGVIDRLETRPDTAQAPRERVRPDQSEGSLVGCYRRLPSHMIHQHQASAPLVPSTTPLSTPTSTPTSGSTTAPSSSATWPTIPSASICGTSPPLSPLPFSSSSSPSSPWLFARPAPPC